MGGKNESQRISHFPWQVLIPCISGISILGFLPSDSLKALMAVSLLVLWRVLSQWSHCDLWIALLHDWALFFWWILLAVPVKSCLAWCFAIASCALSLVISGVHQDLELGPGRLHGNPSSIAFVKFWVSWLSALSSSSRDPGLGGSWLKSLFQIAQLMR